MNSKPKKANKQGKHNSMEMAKVRKAGFLTKIHAFPAHVKEDVDNCFNKGMSALSVRKKIAQDYSHLDLDIPSVNGFINYQKKYLVVQNVINKEIADKTAEIISVRVYFDGVIKKLGDRYHPVVLAFRQCKRLEDRLLKMYSQWKNVTIPVKGLFDAEAQLGLAYMRLAQLMKVVEMPEQNGVTINNFNQNNQQTNVSQSQVDNTGDEDRISSIIESISKTYNGGSFEISGKIEATNTPTT